MPPQAHPITYVNITEAEACLRNLEICLGQGHCTLQDVQNWREYFIDIKEARTMNTMTTAIHAAVTAAVGPAVTAAMAPFVKVQNITNNRIAFIQVHFLFYLLVFI